MLLCSIISLRTCALCSNLLRYLIFEWPLCTNFASFQSEPLLLCPSMFHEFFQDPRFYQYSTLVFVSFKKKLRHWYLLVITEFLRTFFYRTPPDDCFWHIKNKKGKQVHVCNQEDFFLTGEIYNTLLQRWCTLECLGKVMKYCKRSVNMQRNIFTNYKILQNTSY